MAAKKSFKNELNPAMQFITLPEEEPPVGKQEEEKKSARPVQKAENQASKEPEKKETFQKEVIEEVSDKASVGIPARPPAGYKLNPMYIETKSRRLQLLMQPSLHDRVKERAQAEGVSVNEWIHGCLERECKEGQ